MPIKAKYNKDSKSFDSLDFNIEKQIKQQLDEKFKSETSIKNNDIIIDFNIIFPEKFIKLYTNDKFANINEFFGVINVFTNNDLENTPQEIIDNHLKKYTEFNNFHDFLNSALSFKD